MSTSTTVQTLVTEMDARTIELEAKLASAEKKLNRFEASLKDIAPAAEAMGTGVEAATSRVVAGVGQMSDKLAAARAKMLRDFEVFDTKGPAKLAQLGKLYSAQAPAIEDLFKGANLDTKKGIGAFSQQLEQLYATIQKSPDTVKKGALSIQDMESALVDLERTADAAQAELKGAEKGMLSMSSIGPKAAAGIAIAGAALLALTGKSIIAAGEWDGAMRRIGANLPTGSDGLEGVKREIEAVSSLSGRVRADVRGVAEELAHLGVSGTAELEERIRAAALLADATGGDIHAIATGMDQVGDLFQIQTGDMTKSLAAMLSAAKGRVDIESLFDAMQAAAPGIQKLGGDFDTTTRAIVTLLDSGRNARQVGQILKTLDATGLKELASKAKISSTAMEELEKRANGVRDGADRAGIRLKETFSKELEELGTAILPTAIKGMERLLALMGAYDDDLRTTKVSAVDGLAASLLRTGRGQLTLSGRRAAREELGQSLGEIVGGGGEAAALSSSRLGSLSASDLLALQRGLGILATTGAVAAQNLATVQANLHAIAAEAERRGLTSALEVSGGPAATKKLVLPETAEEKAKRLAIAEKWRKASEDLEAEIANNLAAGISGGAQSGVDQALAKLAEFQKSAAQKLREMKSDGAAPEAVSRFEADTKAQVDALVSKVMIARREMAAAMQAQMDDLLVDSTASQVDNLTLALDRLLEKMRQEGASGAQLESARRIRQDFIDATAAIETADQALQQFNADSNPSAGARRGLDDQIVALYQKRASTQPGSVERLDYEKKIKDMEAARLKVLLEELGADKDLAKILSEQHDKMGRIATVTEAAASAAYGLVQVFANGNKELAAMLSSTAQVAGAIAKIRSAQSTDSATKQVTNGWGALDTAGKIASIGSIVGGGIAIVQALSGILGNQESPEEKAHRETIAANTKAILELTQKAGFLGTALNLTPRDVSAAEALLTRGLNYAVTGPNKVRDQLINGRPTTTGLSVAELAELQRIGASVGVTVDGTVESLRQLDEQLRHTGLRLAEFGDDFTGKMAQLDAESKIFGQASNTEQLKRIRDLFGGLSDGVASIFAGLDLSKATDLKRLSDEIKVLFTAMQSGGELLPSGALGGLTGDQFLQVIEQIMGLVNAITGEKSPAEQFQSAKQRLQQELDLFDSTASERLAKAGALYGGASPAIKQLLDGLDTSKATDVATLEERIRALFKQIQEAPDSVQLGALSIEDLIAALLELHTGATAVTAGILTAAQQLSAARSQLETDFEVFQIDDPQKRAQAISALYESASEAIRNAIGDSDLTTDAGRAKAVKALQDLYAAGRGNEDQTQQIVDILRALRAIPGAAPLPGDAAAPAAAEGATSAITNAAQSLTEVTGTRMADFLQAIAINTDPLPEIQSLLAQMFSAPAFTVPAYPSALLAGSGSPIQLTVNADYSNASFYLNGKEIDAAQTAILGRTLAQAFEKQLVETVDQELGKRLRAQQLLAGNVERPFS
ncbi:MAG: hypothetical protein JWO05_1146 [Gemmatimonadetes bacterium]|nr:hypothetical protein [Gemmatimonadota bacterium]